MSRSPVGGPAPLFVVQLTCCGRDAGVFGPCSWDDADKFREGYLSGPGVKDRSNPYSTGHDRSAIIQAPAEPPTDGRASSEGEER